MANLKRALAPVIAALMSLTGCGRIGYIEVDVGSADQATQEPVDGGGRDAAAQEASVPAEAAAPDSPPLLPDGSRTEDSAVDSPAAIEDSGGVSDEAMAPEATAVEAGQIDAAEAGKGGAADTGAAIDVDAAEETGPTCSDGTKNGAETDIDCGGNLCPTCATGGTCMAAADCRSGLCSASRCQNATCPTGCNCFTRSGHAYRFCPATMFRPAAESQCEQWGMRLVQVDDAQEQAWIESIMAALPAQFAWWIGANDMASEDTWLWVNGTQFWQGRSNGSPVDGVYNHWGVGEPNDNGREDCAAIYDHPDWMAANHWADTPCDQDLSSICESY